MRGNIYEKPIKSVKDHSKIYYIPKGFSVSVSSTVIINHDYFDNIHKTIFKNVWRV